MDDNSRRLLLFLAISLGLFFAYQRLFPPPVVSNEPLVTDSNASPANKSQTRDSAPVLRSVQSEGTHYQLETDDARIVFSTSGGSLRHWFLKNPRFTEEIRGKEEPIDLVQTEKGKGPWAFQISFPESDFKVAQDAPYKLINSTSTSVTYIYETTDVRIQKHYQLEDNRNVLNLKTDILNKTDRKLSYRMQYNLYSRQNPDTPTAGITNPYPRLFTGLCFVNDEIHRRNVGAINGEGSDCTTLGCGMGSGEVHYNGTVNWVGTDDRYFLTGLYPVTDVKSPKQCRIENHNDDTVRVSLLYSEKSIASKGTSSNVVKAYLGPKDIEILDKIEGKVAHANLSESIEFGMLAVLCRPMLALLKMFFAWFGNWGVAIILLTILIKSITLYWHQKSMKSMKAMQKLKPQMDMLKTKYKDDKQRLNQEMMLLYKRNKVNPLGGCLPMLIQMPIWIALYKTLGNAQDLYHSGFVLWITDLTTPDPYYVLPVLMGLAMYFQQRITPQPMEGAQAQIMKTVMPVMFAAMMMFLPSGLTLYIFVNTALSFVHQVYINKSEDSDKTAAQASPAKMAKGRKK